MSDKIEQIETKIKGTVEDTRRMVDIKYQVSQRPWAALGVSLLVGYTLGSIGGGLMLMQGLKRMKEVDPVPRETIESVRKDVQWIKEQNPSDKI